ncbi:MAG: VgrG-related protein [Acidimicrobiia bacterium]
MGSVAVVVNGNPMRAGLYDLLVDTRVEQSVQVPDRFSLRFTDPDFALFDEELFTLGLPVDISFDGGAGDVLVSRGEITAVAVEQGATGRHELVVSGLDRAHRLARGTKNRTFSTLKDSDVVQTIAGEHGLSCDVEASAITHDHLLQAGTDYAFVCEAARRCGFEWWVTDQTLHFKAAAKEGSGPTLRWGENLRRFKVRFTMGGMAESVDVYSWDPDTQAIITAAPVRMDSASADGVALSCRAPAATTMLAGAAGSGAFTGTHSLRASPVQSTDEAGKLAAAVAKLTSAEHIRARGDAAGNPRMRAGAEVDIEGLGAKLSGGYVLSAVEHVIGGNMPYTTRFSCGGRRPASLVDLLAGRGDGWAGAGAGGGGWSGRGLVIGVVTNNNDPEDAGRVKVKFPTLGDEDESDWARLATPGAGRDRGLMILPEVNDEVVVGFEHGDPRRPFVLGALWSKQHAPPKAIGEALDGSKAVASRMLKTRTGNTIELIDGATDTESKVVVTLSDGKTKLSLGGTEVTLTSPSPVSVTTDQSLSLKATGDVSIEGANVKIKAQMAATVESVQFEAKGDATAKVSGAQAELSGTATVKVEAAGVTQVKGSILQLN